MNDSPNGKIQYLLDENVDQRIVGPLREREITVYAPEMQGLKGELNDAHYLQVAAELGCVLVTHDRDFIAINEQINSEWLVDGRTHCGIILISSPRSPWQLMAQLEQIACDFVPEQMINYLHII